MHPFIINNLITAVLENNAEMAVCNFVRVNDGTPYENYKMKKTFSGKVKTYNKTEATEQYLSQKKFDFCVWNKIYNLKILKENNITFIDNCRYGEDTNFNYLYLKHINKLVVHINQSLYFYVQRTNSLVHQNFNEKRLDAYYCLNGNIIDSDKNFPEVLKYAITTRTMVCCEMIYFIYKCKYNNVNVINKILEYMKLGMSYLKKCKKVALYRRLLIPLVPCLAKILLRKRIKSGNTNAPLPKSMQLL